MGKGFLQTALSKARQSTVAQVISPMLLLRVNLLRYWHWWLQSTGAVDFAHEGEPRPREEATQAYRVQPLNLGNGLAKNMQLIYSCHS